MRAERVAQQRLEVGDQRGDVTGGGQQSVVAVGHRLGDTTDLGGDDGQPGGERLDDDVRHTVAVPVRGDERGDREDVCVAHGRDDDRAVMLTGERHQRVEARVCLGLEVCAHRPVAVHG